jgi:hypothetical protein
VAGALCQGCSGGDLAMFKVLAHLAAARPPMAVARLSADVDAGSAVGVGLGFADDLADDGCGVPAA